MPDNVAPEGALHPLQRRVRDGDALGVDADGGADVGDAAAGDVGPVSPGVAGHGGVNDRQDAVHVIAGEEQTAAEGVLARGVVEDSVTAKGDVERVAVAVDGAAIAARANL